MGEFVQLVCTLDDENRAHELYEENQRKYASPENQYQPEDDHLPWVGMLGESVFNHWLHRERIHHEWLHENPKYKPDFRIGTSELDCKTVKRQVPPRIDYTCCVPTRQVWKRVDWYVFLSYQYRERRMWLLGAMIYDTFRAEAVDFKAGDQVHPGFIVRAGNEMSNVAMARLVKPAALASLWRLQGRGPAAQPPQDDEYTDRQGQLKLG